MQYLTRAGKGPLRRAFCFVGRETSYCRLALQCFAKNPFEGIAPSGQASSIHAAFRAMARDSLSEKSSKFELL